MNNYILKGEITTFRQLAMFYLKQTGSCSHLREEPWSHPYIEKNYSEGNIESIQESFNNLKEILKSEYKEIIEKEKSSLESTVKTYKNLIAKSIKEKELYNYFLLEAQKYIPPTSEHEQIKERIIVDLQDSISKCSNEESYIKSIKELEKRLDESVFSIADFDKITFDQCNQARRYKSELILDALNDLKRSTENCIRNIEAVNESNDFANQFIKSLPE